MCDLDVFIVETLIILLIGYRFTGLEDHLALIVFSSTLVGSQILDPRWWCPFLLRQNL